MIVKPVFDLAQHRLVGQAGVSGRLGSGQASLRERHVEVSEKERRLKRLHLTGRRIGEKQFQALLQRIRALSSPGIAGAQRDSSVAEKKEAQPREVPLLFSGKDLGPRATFFLRKRQIFGRPWVFVCLTLEFDQRELVSLPTVETALEQGRGPFRRRNFLFQGRRGLGHNRARLRQQHARRQKRGRQNDMDLHDCSFDACNRPSRRREIDRYGLFRPML